MTDAPSASDLETVAGRILAAMALRGLSDTALAARVGGITRQGIAHLTRGTSDGAARAAVATLAALAPALECDPAWLAFGAPYTAPRSAAPTLPGVAAEAEAPEHGAPLPVASLRASLDAARAALPPPVRAEAPAEAVDPAVAAVLAALRAGVSQRRLSRESGVAQSALSELTRGTSPRAATLARLRAWVTSHGASASASVEAA
jgi:transcriptional regulator with XRE-family HTH domain